MTRRSGAGALPERPRFFRSPEEMRVWLAKFHARGGELWVGYYKRATGRAGVTWPESVDEALCFGWIDGVRKRLDDERYTIRFTPRRAGSIWSAVNIRRAQALVAAGRMAAAGAAVFAKRSDARSAVYSYEQRPAELAEPYRSLLGKNRAAAKFFAAQPPWYRRAATWWVVSAKREETRSRRVRQLIADSAAGRTIGPLTRKDAKPA